VIVDMVGLAKMTSPPAHLRHRLADIFCGTLVDDTWPTPPTKKPAGAGARHAPYGSRDRSYPMSHQH
jgi:hypothetical protein